MLKPWTPLTQVSLLILSVLVLGGGCSSSSAVHHELRNDSTTPTTTTTTSSGSTTTLPSHDSPRNVDLDPISPPRSPKIFVGPSESLETTQNPLNPPEEQPVEILESTRPQNPIEPINSSQDSSDIIQDSFYSLENPSEATEILENPRGTKGVSQNPLRSLGNPQNPPKTSRILPDSVREVQHSTQAAPVLDSPDDVLESSYPTGEILPPIGPLPDVLQSPGNPEDDQVFPQLTKELLEVSESILHSLETSYLKDDVQTKDDSLEPSHARISEPKLSIWEIFRSSSPTDDDSKSSQPIHDNSELPGRISDAFNSSTAIGEEFKPVESIQEEFKPVESIQDVLTALESIKHKLRYAESIQDALSLSDSIETRLESSDSLTTSESTRVTQNKPLRGSIMLQATARHAVIDADLLRALGPDGRHDRTAGVGVPTSRRFTGIGRPRALLPPGQKRRRRVFPRRLNSTRPLASSDPHVYAREGGAMSFGARRRYRKKPNIENKEGGRRHKATQEVVEPVAILQPSQFVFQGHKQDPDIVTSIPSVEDGGRTGGWNTQEINRVENGKLVEKKTDASLEGRENLAVETEDFIIIRPQQTASTTARPRHSSSSSSSSSRGRRLEPRMHNPHDIAVYVESEHTPSYTRPAAHTPTHLTHRFRKPEVTSDGRGARSGESRESFHHTEAAAAAAAAYTTTRSFSTSPSSYIAPAPVVGYLPHPSPHLTLNLPPTLRYTTRLTFPTVQDNSPDPVPDLATIYTPGRPSRKTDPPTHTTQPPTSLPTHGTVRHPWSGRWSSSTRTSTPGEHTTSSPSTTSRGMLPTSYHPGAVIREIIGSQHHRFLPSYRPGHTYPKGFTPTLPPLTSPLSSHTPVVWRVTPPVGGTARPPPSHYTAHLDPGFQSSSDLPPGLPLPLYSPSFHPTSPRPAPPPPTTPYHPSFRRYRGPPQPPLPHARSPPPAAGPMLHHYHTTTGRPPPPPAALVAGPRSPEPSKHTTSHLYTNTTSVHAHSSPQHPHITWEQTYTSSGLEYLASNPTYSPRQLGFLPTRPFLVTPQPAPEPQTVYPTGRLHDRQQNPVNTKVNRRIPGITGKPDRDYPTYGAVPPTSFSCDDKLTGYYADPEAYCQVFHMCQYGGQQHSFLCPNGTLFHQQLLTCDHWRNVNCNKATSHYVVNKKLYIVQKKDQYSSKAKRQTPQTYEHQANTRMPSSYWLPDTTSYSYRPIIDSHVTMPSSHTASSLATSPYDAPITDGHVIVPQSYRAVVALIS